MNTKIIFCIISIYTNLSFSVAVQQAKAYFDGLPAKKSPVRGTPGEKYRQKQLIRQLPAHDVDAFCCNELTEEEKKQMELFLKMRKEKCVGRGEVKMKHRGDPTTWVREFYYCKFLICRLAYLFAQGLAVYIICT